MSDFNILTMNAKVLDLARPDHPRERGARRPGGLSPLESAVVTAVVYDRTMNVTEVLSFAKLDDTAREKVLASFAKVLTVADKEEK